MKEQTKILDMGLVFNKDFGKSGLKEYHKWLLPLILGLAFLISNLLVILVTDWHRIVDEEHVINLIPYFQSTILLSISVFLLTYSLFGFIMDDLWKISATMSSAIPRIFYIYVCSLAIILLISHLEIAALSKSFSYGASENKNPYKFISAVLSNAFVPAVILLQLASDKYIALLLKKSKSMYDKTYNAYKEGIEKSKTLLIVGVVLAGTFFIITVAIPYFFNGFQSNSEIKDNQDVERFINTTSLVSLLFAIALSWMEWRIINRISRKSFKDTGFL